MDLYQLKNLQSRATSAENPGARKGAGGQANRGRKGQPCIWPFKAGESHALLDTEGPGMIRHIWCTIPPGKPLHLRNLILRMYWDRQSQPSVEVPLGDFFGVAHGAQAPMLSAAVAMQEGKGFNCWLPMPFRTHARITITNDSGEDISMFFYQVDFTLGDELDADCGCFHAQFRRQNPCPLGRDYVLLDQVAGQGVYIGSVIGVRTRTGGGWWGEGEVKFYIDGDRDFPTICGTGTEDYMGSAWGLGTVLTPYQGAPLVDNANGRYSLYRFHLPDPVYFQRELRVSIQQIGFGNQIEVRAANGGKLVCHPPAGEQDNPDNCYFERSDDWSSVAYWYQSLSTAPFPPLPDRDARSRDILPISSTDAPKRADQ